jgi:hypothetical protein
LVETVFKDVPVPHELTEKHQFLIQFWIRALGLEAFNRTFVASLKPMSVRSMIPLLRAGVYLPLYGIFLVPLFYGYVCLEVML